MQNEAYIPVGKLGRPHGLSGAFRFQLTRTLKNTKKLPAYFLLEKKGRLVPFFVTTVELQGWDGGLLKLEGIDNPEVAKKHSGNTLYLKEKEAKTFFKEDAESLEYLIGYKLLEEDGTTIGEIKELLETPAQILATVKGNNKQFTIPLVDHWIVEVSKRKKEIRMTLPEGLLDI
jgi:16S rRNA processing protein RimM